MKNAIKVICVIIGTIIGAGFASGQEIYTFFYSYGIKGILGLLLCSLLIGIVIYKVLSIIHNENIENYKEFLEKIINKQKKSSKKYLNINFIINTIINIFLLISFYIMVAGFGAYFSQELGINSLLGCIIIALLCFFVFTKDVKGVVKANEIITPFLILFMTLIGVLNLKEIDISNIVYSIQANKNFGFALSSILYCSYNSILLIPVLITLKKYVKNKKDIFCISSISGIIIFIISICIFFILTRVDTNILELEMPVVYVISKFFSGFKNIYGFIILASIFTTSISIGISYLQNVSKNKKSYTQIAIIMCITSIPISKIGFSNLVTFIYPIFGYLGLLQILKIMIKK